MLDPRLILGLADWLMARVPEVGDRVQPLDAPPSDTPPFIVYGGTYHEHVLTLKELTGQVKARAVLIVWHTDHLEACRLALRIVGTKADPGLHGRGGPLAYSAFGEGGNAVPAGSLPVQRIFFLPDSVQRDVAPIDGSEQHWYAVPLEFEFVYTTG